jgi:hypothetical protein
MSRNSSLSSFSTPNNVSHDYTPLHENLTRVQVAMERKVILICEGAVDYLQVLSARQESFFLGFGQCNCLVLKLMFIYYINSSICSIF